MPKIFEAQSLLDHLCNKVKLVRETLPSVDGISGLPQGAAFWSAGYACLLLWPITGVGLENFKESAAMAQDFLDGILSEREGRNKHTDGYLVLALSEKPSGELDKAVRSLELSTNICRKNAIWPETDNASIVWSRISDVAVLGLPDIVAERSEKLTWPNMSEDVKALWLEVGGGVAQKVGDTSGR
jgi:hypothetical protein